MSEDLYSLPKISALASVPEGRVRRAVKSGLLKPCASSTDPEMYFFRGSRAEEIRELLATDRRSTRSVVALVPQPSSLACALFAR